jgi:tetratricopeptide (TPR) repeat protein
MTISSNAQQVQLKGIVTVQNSKTNTGQTQYVKNAEVSHTTDKNAKTKDVTGNDGKFTLTIKGVPLNTQTQITVTLYGDYADYAVVNEKDMKDITLGRVIPVNVYVCKKGELELRLAEMVGINMRKLEERAEKDKKRLQKELDELKLSNNYLNTRYRELKDSLNSIDENIDKAFEKIKEYAQMMILENLDDKDENYVKAYNCFSLGELDSVAYYLSDDYLDNKYEKIVQLQEEAKKEKALAAVLTESARQKEEFSGNSLNDLLKEWLLLARTYDMKNEYEKAKTYYEKAIQADATNANTIFEYANYLHSIREHAEAEKQYLRCLEIHRTLEKENPKAYLPNIAMTFYILGNLHKDLKEYPKALEKYEKALDIRRNLAAENPKALPYVAMTLNNLALLHNTTKEYPKSLEEYKEVLEIRRKLAAENPKVHLPYLATTLNNLGILHLNTNEYSTALEEYKEALEILRRLDVENNKAYLPDIAMT